MLEDHRTWLLAADFDEESWQEDVSAFRETCLSVGISPAVERSRSGCGAHVWFEGAEVAGELLDLLCSSELPIQLSFE